MIHALSLCALVHQSTPAPAVDINWLLQSASFFLQGPEPKIMVNRVSFAFAPAGPFASKMVVSEGSQTVQELLFRDTSVVRGGVFAEVPCRVPGSVSMGAGNGERTIEFMVDGKVAGRFKFTLNKSSNGDPLDPKVSWKIVGPWATHAFFSHKPDDGSRQDIELVFWVASHELVSGERTVVATLKKGTSEIAKTPERIPNGAPYSRFATSLIKPNKDPLQVKDLKGLSGSYTLEVTAGKRVLRSWKLSIANGGFVPHLRSDHTKTDPTMWLSPRVQIGYSVSPYGRYWLAP
jgi:hypothetical protein